MAPTKEQLENPFFFEAELDTKNLQEALSKAEKMYKHYDKSINKLTAELAHQDVTQREVTRSIIASIKQESDVFKERSKAIERMMADEKKQQEEGLSRWEKSKKRLYKKLGILDEEKAATGKIALNWKGIGLAIFGTTGLIVKAARDFLEFDNQAREISVTLGTHKKLYAESRSIMMDYRGYLGMTRDELMYLTKSMGEVGLAMDQNAKGFRKTAVDIIHLSKAIDVGTGTVVDLYHTFEDVYKLPHRDLRKIASSMKFIQEQTAISGEELVTFAKSLDNVLSRMTKISGSAKTDVTADLMAMAGSLKNVVDPDKIGSLFGEALRIESEEGHQWLAFLTRNTGIGIRQMREQIEKGDVVTPMTMFIRQLKAEGPEALKLNESFYTQMTGMSMAELTRLMQFDEKQMVELIKRNKAAQKQADLHQKAALARQNKMSRWWAQFKNILSKIWLSVGGSIVKVAVIVGEKLVPHLLKFSKWLEKTASYATSSSGARRITDFFKNLWRMLKEDFLPVIKAVGKGIGWLFEKAGDFVKWIGSLDESQKKLLLVGGGLLVLFTKLGPIMGTLGGKVMGIATALTAVYLGAKKIAAWADEQQNKQIKAQGVAKSTAYAIGMAAKGSKEDRVQWVRAEMKSKEGLIGSGGQINMEELQKRAAIAVPIPWGMETFNPSGFKQLLKMRQQLVSGWSSSLKSFMGSVDMKDVEAAQKRHEAMFKKPAAAPAPPPVNATPATPVTTPSVESDRGQGQAINVKAESPESVGYLAKISRTLDGMASRGQTTPQHPSASVLEGALR